jgi:hypothetical protein
MKTVMVLVLEESEDISLDLLSPILDSLNKDNEVTVWKFNVIIFRDYETENIFHYGLLIFVMVAVIMIQVISPIARKLGESVLQSCPTKLKSYLRQVAMFSLAHYRAAAAA